jgi:hypothetical protein
MALNLFKPVMEFEQKFYNALIRTLGSGLRRNKIMLKTRTLVEFILLTILFNALGMESVALGI